MKQNSSFEQQVGIKIGLVLLIIILYVVGVLIYSYELKRNIDSQKEEIAASSAVMDHSNRLIVLVQQAQDALNAYLVTPQQKIQLTYDSLSTIISDEVANIKMLTPPQAQTPEEIYLENIDSLLEEKNKIVNLLIKQFQSKSPMEDLDKKINTFDGFIQDSVVVTTSKDTTIVVNEKKSFWNRFKNLVNPKQTPDTLVSIAQTEQETHRTSRIDTVMYTDLKNMTKKASKTYTSQIIGIEKRVRELILAEQSISLQISQLITEFYSETNNTTQQGMHNSEKLTRKIFTFAVVVGALSLLLIIIIILLIINDLKRGQKARNDLAKEKQLTESLMESRHKLLLSVSHDIKTPLSSMMGYMEMWASEDDISENQKQQIKSAQNSGMHILNMLTNLLEFSRLERNVGTLHIGCFDLVDLMSEIINMFKPLTEEKKLKMTFENGAQYPFFVETDYTILKQILINIISNAVKYTSQGQIDISLNYKESVILSISDTGIGMNKHDIEEIYKPFSRIENPLNAEGSGFGMYVTKGLIESLKGEIHIESEKDKGTQVTIKLPIHPVEKKAETNSTNSTQNTFSNILIFEDDISLGNMIKEFLIRKGHKVKVCSDSRDVDGFINHLSMFDVVFTDMQMLNVTGNQVLEKIRKVNLNIPVWLMTAHDDYNTQKTISEGFSGLIKKPIQMNTLNDILCGKSERVSQEKTFLNNQFPQLTEMFGDDTETIKEILTGFVRTSKKDTALLEESIKNSNFSEAQHICHRMHPFLCQIGANNLCSILQRMDSLRGQSETAYPTWKEDLLENIQQIREFVATIEKEFS